MKHYFNTFICLFLSMSFSFSQETSIDQEFGNNLVLMDAGNQFGSNVLRMDNTTSSGLSYIQYRHYFEQTNFGQIWDEWRVGLSGFGTNNDDYTIGKYNLVQDFVVFTPSLIIEEEDNFIGINTFDAEAQVHVNHSDVSISNGQQAALLLGESSSSEGYLTVNKPANDTNSNIARFRDDGSSQVWINRAANTYQLEVFGDARATGLWFTSDERLKKDIQGVKNALDKIERLEPRTYHYDTTRKGFGYLPQEKQWGLIAQNVKEVFPTLVKESEHFTEDGKSVGNFESVNYTALIPVLVSAVQDLNTKIKTLESQNQALHQQNQDLERSIKKLSEN